MRAFTRGEILRIHEMSLRGKDLSFMAAAVNRPRDEVDIALWMMMGRRPVGQVLEDLNQGRKQ